MTPGIYENLSAAAYHAAPGASHSRLEWLVDHCPAELRWDMDHPEPRERVIGTSDPLGFGAALHDAVLLPRLFEAQYRILPFDDLRAAGAKAWVEKTLAEDSAVSILRADAFAKVEAMRVAVLSHETAAKLIAQATHRELSVFWADPQTGTHCKMRADMVIVRDGTAVVMDLKTTSNPGPEAFGKQVSEYGYHRQAAYYLDALSLHGIPAESFGFIAVGKDAPHAVAVYALSQDAIATGRDENRELLDRYSACEKSGVWPGYAGVSAINLPSYYRTKI